MKYYNTINVNFFQNYKIITLTGLCCHDVFPITRPNMLNFSKKCYEGLTVPSNLHVRLTYGI